MILDLKEIAFKHPFCMTVAGPSQSGKTHFVYNVLKLKEQLIDPIPDKIIYCYSVWQPLFNELTLQVPNIEFINGIPELEQIVNSIIIIDDLMTECIDNKEVVHLFTVGSHHKNASVIFLTQNVYEKGKYARAISLNSHYIVLFNNRRDISQIMHLGRQLYPGDSGFFKEIYNDAISKPYGHLILDLMPKANNQFRIRSLDFNNNSVFIYNKK